MFAALAVFAVAFAGAAGAASGARAISGPAGIVPSLNGVSSWLPSPFAGRLGSNLQYHGGPVMRTNTTYAIFWLPSGSGLSFGGNNSGYESTIDQFLGDVGHDSGGTANVFGIDTQYTDTTGPIAYSSTFGGSVVATDPLPARQCSDGWGDTDCVTETQIENEVQSVVTAQGWSQDTSHLYFLFTPQGLGSCAGSECSYTTYCAYHDFFSASGTIVFGNEPWTYGSGYDCDSGQYPNGGQADPTINVLSHEFNEAVTDPVINAWYDLSGNEIGDKCAWDFGSLSGPSGAEYNQTINGHHYYLQQEWDNASSACQQHPTPAAAPAISSFSPTSGIVGTAVTIKGSGFTGATAVKFNGTPVASFVVASSTKITTTVPSGATTGAISVTGPGGTATSSAQFTVIAPPAITSFSPPSAADGAQVTINGSGFTGTKSVKFNGKSTTFSVLSDSQIHAKVPAGMTSGPIMVTTTRGTATSSSSFLVLPTLSSFSPSKGRVGATVTVKGSGFTGATAVGFNGTAATSFTVSSDSKITVTVPVGATTGTVSVTTPSGTATSSAAFTVQH